MRWSDEPYVKLYRRTTADMLAWCWQARALWPWLLARADNAGLVDTGKRDPVGAVALLTNLPREVVEPGLADLLSDGCLEQLAGGYLVRNYVEAQEATKTPRQKKRDQRERERDARRSLQRGVIRTPPVTECHQRSPSVTDCPPPTPTPTPTPTPVPFLSETGADAQPRKRKAPERPPDPRHAPLVLALVDACPGYTFDGGRDARAVTQLLVKGEPEEVLRRWRLALATEGFPRVRTLSELSTHWNHFAGAGPPTRAGGARVVDLRKAPVRAEDVNQEALAQVGDVTQELFRGRQP